MCRAVSAVASCGYDLCEIALPGGIALPLNLFPVNFVQISTDSCMLVSYVVLPPSRLVSLSWYN